MTRVTSVIVNRILPGPIRWERKENPSAVRTLTSYHRAYQGSVFIVERGSVFDETILNAEYEILPVTGLEISEIGADGGDYAIHAEIVDDVIEFDWAVRSCPDGGGGMDAALSIKESALDRVMTDCDTGLAFGLTLEQENHEDHQFSRISLSSGSFVGLGGATPSDLCDSYASREFNQALQR